MNQLPRYPVFIVGSARSGTSALVDGLMSVGYQGYREGMLLSLIFKISQLTEQHFKVFGKGKKRNMLASVDKDKLKDALFQVFKDTVTELNPTPPWLDKTGSPEMIRSIPHILKLWPDAAVVFAKRRGIENVLSRIKKFPAHDFEHHCQSWAANMTAWRRIRTQLPQDAFVEVDQQDMIQQPEKVAEALTKLLRMPENQQRRLAATFQSKRPQQTEKDSAKRVYSLKTSGFSEEQAATFLNLCKEEMEAFGYSTDERYRVAP
jgi:Sulfotransferase family